MAKRFPANSIHLMKICRTQKGWWYNLAVDGKTTDGARVSESWPGRGLPCITINSSLRDLYRAALQLLFL